jgi:hypothetical protein
MRVATIGLLILVVIAGTLYWLLREPSVPAPGARVEAPVSSLDSPLTQPAPETPMRHPLPPAPPTEAEPTTTDTAPAEEQQATPEPLPSLDNSDALVGESFGELTAPVTVTDLFLLKNLVRHLVVTIDNLPKKKLPLKYRPFTKVPGEFAASGEGLNSYVLSPENYARYAPFINVIDAINVDRAVAVYIRLYPLFQQAYEELGYPSAHFNDRLVEVLDHLLQAPAVDGPVRLVRESVFYKFADPALENLSAGHKILLRIGPDNRTRVLNKLRAFRQALTARR